MFIRKALTRIGLNRLARKFDDQGEAEKAAKCRWCASHADALDLAAAGVEDLEPSPPPPVFASDRAKTEGWLSIITFILENADEIMALIERIIELFTDLNPENPPQVS